MSVKLFYFSGSGNSYKVAKDIAEELKEAEIIPIAKALGGDFDCSADAVGLIFPVYAWGMPRMVLNFTKQLETDKYVFAVITYGGSAGNTMRQTKKILAAKGTKLWAGFGLQMPDCYIPMFDAHSNEEQQRMFREEQHKVKEIAAVVSSRLENSLEVKKTSIDWILSGIVYRPALKYFKKSDKSFWTDSNCNSCEICRRVCPAANIIIEEGRPVWKHNCEACMACLQWCPKASIQYGRKSLKRKRYRHPEVSIKEMILRD